VLKHREIQAVLNFPGLQAGDIEIKNNKGFSPKLKFIGSI
jgi:hypothetical protein